MPLDAGFLRWVLACLTIEKISGAELGQTQYSLVDNLPLFTKLMMYENKRCYIAASLPVWLEEDLEFFLNWYEQPSTSHNKLL